MIDVFVGGYVAGHNRFLQDHAGKLPAACNGKPWGQPMTLAHFYRATEVVQVQTGAGAGAGALAYAIAAATPPKADAPKTSAWASRWC